MKNFDQILTDLRDPSEEIRQAAVMELIKTNDMTVIPILRDMASSDESVKIRYYAKKGLHFLKSRTLPRALTGKRGPTGEIPPEDPDRLSAPYSPGPLHALSAGSEAPGPVSRPKSPFRATPADTGDPAIRQAEAAWRPIPGDSLSTEITQTFASGDDDGKINIVQRAVKLSATQTLPLLQNLLEGESNPFVKSKLIVALGILGDENQIPVLRSYLGDPDYRIRANTIEALGYIGHRSVYPLILDALNDNDNRIRANAIKIINKFGRTKVKDLLENMIRGGDPAMIASAVSVIGEIGRPELITLLSDAASVGGREIMPKVEQALMNLSKQNPEAGRILEEIKKSGAAGRTSPSSIEDIITQKIRESLTSEDSEVKMKGVREAAASSNPALARPLTELLSRETDPKIRAAAVNAIGRVGAREALAAVKAALEDSDPRTRANAVEVYGSAAPDGMTRELEPLLNDKNNRVKANAALALARIDHEGAAESIRAMASSKDPMTQRSAIYVIMDLEGREDLVAMLGPMVNSPNQTVRSKAIESLGILADSGSAVAVSILSRGGITQTHEEITESSASNTGPGQITETSRKDDGVQSVRRGSSSEIRDSMVSDLDIERMNFDLGSENPTTRKNAARILENIGDERCLDALQHATKDQDNSVRYYAGKAFNAIKRRIDFDEKVVTLRPSRGEALDLKELERLLADGNRDTRISAIQQVKITDHQTLPLLLRQIAVERDDFVKPALISTIGMLGDEKVVQALLPHLASEDPRVRANTIEALEYTCDSSVFSHIVPMLQDSNNRVKANAIKALQNNGKEGTLNLLSEMTFSPEVWMRDSAAFALGTIKDLKTIKILEALLIRESNPSVTLKAAKSLSQVCGRQGTDLIRELMYRSQTDEFKVAALTAALDACEGRQVNFQSLASTHEIQVAHPADPKASPAARESPAAGRESGGSDTSGRIPETSLGKAPSTGQTKAVPSSTPGVASAVASAAAGQGPEKSDGGGTDKVGKVVAKLASDMKNEDEEVRKKAVLALSKIDHPDVLPLLEEAVNDKETVVRFFAKKALQAKNKFTSAKQTCEAQRQGQEQEQARSSDRHGQTSARQETPGAAPDCESAPGDESSGSATVSSRTDGAAKFHGTLSSETRGFAGILRAVAVLLIAAGLGMTWYLNRDSAIKPENIDSSAIPTVMVPVNEPIPKIKFGKPNTARFFKSFDEKAVEAMKWGNLNARKAKFERAAEDFAKAVDAAPLSLEANLKYLFCLSKTGSQRIASARYRQSMGENPSEPLYRYLLAIAAPSKEMAERELAALKSSNPEFPYALLSLSAIRMSAGDWRAAIEPLEKFTEIMGPVPTAVLAKARCFLGAELPENASTEFEEVIARFTDDPGAVLLGGRIYIKTGKYDKAVSLLEKALETDPLHSGMLSHIGLAHLESGRPDKAREFLERASRVAPGDRNALYLLGKVCDSLGDGRAAFEANLKAAKADPACGELFGSFVDKTLAAPGSSKKPGERLFRESPDPGEIPMEFFWPAQ